MKTPTHSAIASANTSASGAFDTGSLSEQDRALQEAGAAKREVEVASARTETSDTWARPDGSFVVKDYGTPVRFWREGSWAKTDPTLVFAADGSVVSKATPVSVKFSGGGTDQLLAGAVDGRTLALTWPKALPKPTLAGNIATYAEVLPGVDLRLRAEVEGFSQLLVVKTPAAAKNPELKTLNFALNTVGLTVQKDEQSGSLRATDPAGQLVFTSPAPVMWDSSGAEGAPTDTGAQASARADATAAGGFEPGVGARSALMGTTVTDTSLSLVPDSALLTSPGTTYPVYIDPSWDWGDRQQWNWARVYKKWPDNSYWNAKEDVRVGYEAETNGLSRSFLQVDTSKISGTQIKESVLRLKNTWSWSCTDAKVSLFATGPISSRTTWRNQPKKLSGALSTVNDSKGWGPSCPAGNLEFTATDWVRDQMKSGETTSLTFGLYADNESDTTGWKRFDPKTVVLETVFNHLPDPPKALGTSPATQCATGGRIGNTTVSLHAMIKDEDGGSLNATFEVRRGSTLVYQETVPTLNNRVATVTLPASSTPSGSYTWRVMAKDGDKAESAWVAARCAFEIDRDRPSNPPSIRSEKLPDGTDKYPPGERGWPEITGPARTETVFSLAPNGVKDVVAYYWWTDTDAQVTEVSAAAPTARVFVPSYGPHTVHAYSVDKAGNRSDTRTYLYYATRSQQADKPGDLNGDQLKDIWSVDGNGTLLTYSGLGSRTFAAATNGGGSVTFPDRQTSFSGDWGQDGFNDLLALQRNAADGRKQLLVYNNDGRGIIDDEPVQLRVKCPVPDPRRGCTGEEGWTGNDHWFNAEQVIAAGDLNADRMSDVLVKQGQNLWAYFGNKSSTLNTLLAGRPVLVGGTDWRKFTVVVPGDMNSDTLPDLWLRNDSTGELFQANGRRETVGGKLDFASWGSPGTRKLLATGLSAATFPLIGTSGDLDGDDNADGVDDGDAIPDLWARKADNTVIGRRGQGTGTQLTGFGAPFVIDSSAGGTRIPAGTRLESGQSVTSNSVSLVMKPEGDLVIRSKTGNELWSSHTASTTIAGATALVHSDGNIGIYQDDTLVKNVTGVSSPGEGYAFLQDRGNLVVHNDKGESLWSSGTVIRHDYDGDGRSDFADWYGFPNGADVIHTFMPTTDGVFTNGYVKGLEPPATHYDPKDMQFATGDYNGDGRGDVAWLYDYGDGQIKLHTALGSGSGKFGTPFISYTSKAGSWNASNMTLQSGDFNGDGRDDLAAWYDYFDGHDTLFTFTSNVRGGFNPPFGSHTQKAGGWEREKSKFVTGDFNGDGRDDLAALYGYSDGSVKMHTFTAAPTGAFNANLKSWSGTITSWGDWDRTYIHAGDFNGDGQDDVTAWYDYADGHDALHTLLSTSNDDGSFSSPKQGWTSAPGNWYYPNMKIVAGDYNGDGRDDLGAMYGYENGTVRMFTWLAAGSPALPTFEAARAGWSTASGWDFDRVRPFRTSN
ncbi:FG-GAP-like repeat-containing protein [Streptomyces sp. NPDC097619]|uniref:FG-GAP-like repeat-containing protein n=1 Tax=Streptomyces sp. NPDC097619 TaxID=3157228 RepID=UPI003333043E